jgi:hypothetical protein
VQRPALCVVLCADLRVRHHMPCMSGLLICQGAVSGTGGQAMPTDAAARGACAHGCRSSALLRLPEVGPLPSSSLIHGSMFLSASTTLTL